MKRRGFTWLKTVVVLTVLIIAVVVFLPVYSTRHTPSRRSACQSNLKQIALAFRIYSQDYGEKYPLAVANNTVGADSAYGWADALQPYLKTAEILQCQTETNSPAQPPDPTQQGYTDYWFNRNLASVKEEEIEAIALTILSGDGNDGNDATTARYSISKLPAAWRRDMTSPAYRHFEGANYAFTDGHVKWYKPISIPDTAKDDGAPTFAAK